SVSNAVFAVRQSRIDSSLSLESIEVDRPGTLRRMSACGLVSLPRLCLPDETLAKRQPVARAVDGGKEEPGDEGEVVDEESELHLVADPMRGAMESEGEEQHIGGGQQCGFGEERAGEKGQHERDFEESGNAGEE